MALIRRTRTRARRSDDILSAELARACAQMADDKKGDEILVLDLRKLTYVTDFFVIASAGNPRQLSAMSAAVDQEMRRRGVRPIGIQGADESGWILHDYADVIVHLFDVERRKLYDLELLWGDAPRFAWQDGKAKNEK